MKNDLTALDFWGKPVWTSGTDDERAARLRAYEATGMEPEGIVEMKRVQALTGAESGEHLAKIVDRWAAETATAQGYSMEELMGGSIDKLRRRYPEGFEAGRSINRDERED